MNDILSEWRHKVESCTTIFTKIGFYLFHILTPWQSQGPRVVYRPIVQDRHQEKFPGAMKYRGNYSFEGFLFFLAVNWALLSVLVLGTQTGPSGGWGARFQSVGCEINPHSKYNKMSSSSGSLREKSRM